MILPKLKNNFTKIKNNAFYYSVLLFAFSVPLSKFMVSLSGIFIIFFYFLPSSKPNITIANKKMRMDYLLLLYILLHLIGLLYTENLSRGIQYILNMWYLMLIPLIVRKINENESKNIVYAFIIGVLIAVIVSYTIYFFGLTNLKYKSAAGPVAFMDHRHYSLILSLVCALFFDYILSSKTQLKYKINAIIILIILLYSLSISGGRTGIISFMFVSIVLLIKYFKEYKIKILIPLISILFVASLFYFQNISLQKRFDLLTNGIEKIIDDNDYNSSLGGRIALARVGLVVISEHFFLGVGTGDGIDIFRKKVDKDYPNYEFTGKLYKASDYHNQFIQTFVLLGFSGFIVLIMIYLYIFNTKINSLCYLKNINYILFSVFLIASLTELLLNAMILISTFTVFTSVLEINKNYEIKVKDSDDTENKYI